MGTFKMGMLEAFVHWTIIVFFMCSAVVVCLDSTKYVFEKGTDAHVPCLFGNGTVKNIFWEYHNGTEYVAVVKLFKGQLFHGTNYEGHVDLHEDKSTLIIRDVSIGDEGRYKCDVDKEDGPSILNKLSDVSVFVRPNRPYPLITECNNQGEQNSCKLEFPDDTPFSLTCRISEYYPRDNAILHWQIPGNEVLPSTSNTWHNEDRTWDMLSTLDGTLLKQITYTCFAEFTSDGFVESANTSVMVSPKSPDKENRKRSILIATLIVIVTVIVIVIVILLHRRRRARNVQGNSTQRGASQEMGNSTQGGAPQEMGKLISSTTEETSTGIAGGAASGDREIRTPNQLDFDKILEAVARDIPDDSAIESLGKALGFGLPEISLYIKTNSKNAHINSRGTLKMLRDWQQNVIQSEEISKLKNALIAARLRKIADDHLAMA